MTAVDKAVARAVKAYAAYRGKDGISDEGEVLTDMLADGPEVDERCQECDEYPEDCICCEGDCPKSQGCPRCSYNNDEEDEEEE